MSAPGSMASRRRCAAALAAAAVCPTMFTGPALAPAVGPPSPSVPAARLDWRPCVQGGRFDCATAKVPLDYRDPDRRTIELSVEARRDRPRPVEGSVRSPKDRIPGHRPIARRKFAPLTRSGGLDARPRRHGSPCHVGVGAGTTRTSPARRPGRIVPLIRLGIGPRFHTTEHVALAAGPRGHSGDEGDSRSPTDTDVATATTLTHGYAAPAVLIAAGPVIGAVRRRLGS